MAYRKNQRVEINKRYTASTPARSCGFVAKRYGNGNYRVRITHDPNCTPLNAPVTLPSVPEKDLDPCHCS